MMLEYIMIIVQIQKISILPHGNSSLASYFASKILAFETPPPLPLGSSDDPPWGGYVYFLNCTLFWSLSSGVFKLTNEV